MSTPTPEVEAPDLSSILANAKSRDELREAVRMIHRRNVQLQKVRDGLAHELYVARTQLLSDSSRP